MFQDYLSIPLSPPQWRHTITGPGKANSDISSFPWTAGPADTAKCEGEGYHHDPEVLVRTEVDSFLQALFHGLTHLTASSTYPPQNSSQAYFVFLTGGHVPPLRATVISQGRQLSRPSIPIHLDKRWVTKSHV